MKKIKNILLTIALFLLLTSPINAQFNGGFSGPNLWKLSNSTVSLVNSNWSVSIPTLSIGAITMTGNLDLNGNELILDADGDTVVSEISDDNILYSVGGATANLTDPDGTGFPAGLYVSTTQGSGAITIPSGIIIDTMPSSGTATALSLFGNNASVDFNGLKCVIVDEAVTIQNSDEIVFSTNLETLNITRTITDFVYLEGTDSDEDGIYMVSGVSTVTATVTNLLSADPSFSSTTGIASYCTLRTSFGNTTIDSNLFLSEGYEGDNKMISIDHYGDAGSEPLIDIQQKNTAFTEDIFRIKTDATNLTNSAVFDIDMNSSGAAIVLDADTNSASTLYGLYILTSNIGAGNAYGAYFDSNVGIGDSTPEVGLKLGTGASSHSIAGNNDLIVNGQVEFNNFVYFDNDLKITDAIVKIPGSDQTIVAGTGLTLAMIQFPLTRIIGSGGAVDITAIPQIVDGVDGQEITLQGTNDTSTVKFDDSTGLCLSGGVSFTMGNTDILRLIFDTGEDCWIEISRSDN